MCERPNRHGSHHHAGIAVGEEGRSKGGKAKKWFDENQVIGSSVFVALSRFCADVKISLAQSDPPLDARGVARKQRLSKVNKPSKHSRQTVFGAYRFVYIPPHLHPPLLRASVTGPPKPHFFARPPVQLTPSCSPITRQRTRTTLVLLYLAFCAHPNQPRRAFLLVGAASPGSHAQTRAFSS